MLSFTHGIPFTRLQIWLYGRLAVLTTLLPVMIGMSGTLYLVYRDVFECTLYGLELAGVAWAGCRAPVGAFRFSMRYLLGVFGALILGHYAAVLG